MNAENESVAKNRFEPESHPRFVRAEVPRCDEIHDVIAEATIDIRTRRIFDLGSRTGETAGHVLERHPGARVLLAPGGRLVLAGRPERSGGC
jgi:hypothetical protein